MSSFSTASRFRKSYSSAVAEASAGDGRFDVPLADGSGSVRVSKFYEGVEVRGLDEGGLVYILTDAGAVPDGIHLG